MCKGPLFLCYVKISLKTGRVTGSLHNPDFADTIFLKMLIFRQAKRELRGVITTACTQFRRERERQNSLRLMGVLAQKLMVVGWP